MYKLGRAALKFLDLVVIFVMVFGSPTSVLAQGVAPTVTSDKADYLPGELVTITGVSWVADTQVHLVVNDAIGQTWSHDVVVEVVDGGFVDAFNLPTTFISDYLVTATGVQSGQSATATFTDAPGLTLTKSASPLTYTAAGQVISFSYLLKNTGTTTLNGPFTVADNKVSSVSCPATATLAPNASITCTGAYTIKSVDMTLGYAANTATASSSNPGATSSNTDVRIVSFPVTCRNDSDGANDVPGQKDLTQECDAPTAVNPLVISWNWDVISQPGGNSADACALFDTNNNGLADYALCSSWQNARVMQAGYPVLYSCTDTRSDRCTGSTPLTITHGSTCTLELAPDDPFSAGDSYPNDTKAFCSINLADVGGAAISNLIDVCSYPSAIPNSDPSDCVVISAAKGNLEVIKSVVPDDPNTNWNISWSGPTPYSGTIAGSGTTTIQTVSAGSYDITEAAGTGTDLSLYDSTWACTVDGSPSTSGSGTTITGRSVAKGSVVICTFTNTRKTGSLQIFKDVVPDNASTNWNFGITGPTAYTCAIAGDGSCTAKTVNTGSYSITETAGTGTSLGDYGTTWACTVNSVVGPSGSGTTISGLTINKSDTVVCTFTNSQSPGTLTVNKVVLPSTDTGKFNLLIDGTSKASNVGDGGTTGAVSVSAGSHTVSESAGTGTDLNNYVTTIAGDCDSSGNVSVSPNQNKTCTITNTRKGTIIVEKQTDPDGAAGSFTFTGDAAGTISDNGQIVVSNLAPGTYTSTESSLAADFALAAISCDDASSATPSIVDLGSKTATFKLDPGETVKCTFTNKKLNPELAVSKTADAASVTAGDAVGFSISVKNNGLGTANNVTLSDTLPSIPGVTWAIASQPAGNPCTLTGNSLSCTFGNLAAGATAGPVHITGTSTGASCGTWNNTATGQADNNTAVTGSASIFVDCATIKITKTAVSGTVSAGDPISFTITATNDNSGTAHNVTVTDTLPSNAGLGTWTLSGTDAGACSISSGKLTCNFGDVAGHASKTVTLTTTTTAASCGTVSNTAFVTTSNDGTDQSTAAITVQCPSLSVTKTPDEATVNAGDPVGFLITVSNAGPGQAKGVTLTDTLPGGLTWAVDASNTTATGCKITSGVLTCGPDTIASGSNVKVHVTATSTPLTCGPLSNTATATPTNGDAATSTTATVTVNCADVTVTKTGNGPVTAGDTATFTINVSVTGSGTLKNVTLNDPLPAGVTWALDSVVTGCSISGASPQTLSCSWATLAAPQTITINVSGTTSQGNCAAPLSNTATVAAANETDTTNDTANASIAVQCASIQIEKTTTTPTVSAGDPISYTITVSNPGAGIARSVTITDTLPTTTGLNWSYPAACSVSGGILTCNLGDIAGGGSKSVTLTSPTTAASCGTISNKASVTTTNDGSATTPNAVITVQCPNLSVTKTADAATVSAGDTIGFTITVSNAGPGVAKGVMLTDTLPGGLAWTVDAANTTATGCSITSGVLTCGPATLASGGSVKVHVTAASTPAVCGELSNSATATPTNGDAATSQVATVTVLCPDLTVTKTGNGPISAGDTATFTITVKNTGLGVAKNVTLTDTLPGGLTWALDPSNPACSIGGSPQVLSCSWPTLASNASVSVSVSAVTTKDNCGMLSNTATAAASNEQNTSNNSSGAADLEVECATIQIEKTTATPTVSAGDPISYTVTVSNPGLGIARNVVVTDSLPTTAGLNWSINPAVSGCSISGGTLTCNFGDIASGGSKSVTLTSPTTYASCGTIDNTASVTTGNDGAATTPATDIAVQCPALTVTKTADAASVSAGDTIGFAITVSNDGDGVAKNVTLSDTLPTGTGISWSISPAVTGCSITSGVLTCSFGDLAKGDSKMVHVTSPTTAGSCTTYNNTATASASNQPSVTSSLASITVQCASIQITKVADTGPFSAGDSIGFTIEVTNPGPGTGYGVAIADTLPSNSGLDWTISPAVQGCSISSGVLTCNVGTLAANKGFLVHISSPTTAASCGTVSNIASVTTTNDGSGNASDSLTVNCPDLTVEKIPDAGSVTAGDAIGFTINIHNGGLGKAYGVSLSDTLPTTAGTNWTISPAVQGCTIASGVLTCDVGTLLTGASFSVHISSPTTPASCGGKVDNTATVTATNEANTSNNSGGGSVTVNCPSLTVTKTADAASVNADDSIGFTITVSNGGPGVAKSVNLTDTLPTGTGISWSLAGGTGAAYCSISSGVLTCNFGDMAASASYSVHVTSPTAPLSCGVYNNTATVTSANQADVTGSGSTTVNCPSLVMTKVAEPATINAGETAKFVITIQNIGAGTAYNLVLKDTLPANYDTVTSTPAWDSVSYTPNLDGTTLFQANYGSLAAGGAITVTVSMKPVTTVCGEIYNAAQLTAGNSTGTAVSDATITVNCPDVTVTKTAASGAINAGENISFNITVKNVGAGTAKNVTLSDTLPTGAGLNWSIGGTDGAACSITSGVVTCNFGDLAPGAIKTITLTSPTTKDSCGTYNNTATVASTNEYTGLDNNSSTASVTTLCANISILKRSDPASGVANAGDTIFFQMDVVNGGAGTAKDVVISDTLPNNPGLHWVLSSLSKPVTSTGSCSVSTGSPQVLTCNFDQLVGGQSIGLRVASVTTLATACATINNTAAVTTSNDGSDNSSATIKITCPNVGILKRAFPATGVADAGDTIFFQMDVFNTGLSAASDVVISDTLPSNPGLHWVLSSLSKPVSSTGSCSVSTGSPQVLTCNFDQLVAGQSIGLRVASATTYATCGTVSNTASFSTGNDGSGSSTPATTMTVNCPALEVTKTPDTQTVSAGDPISFSINVNNSGAGMAKNVTLSDQLPLGVTWSVNNPACTVDANNLLTCNFGDLAASASASVTVTGDSIPAMCGTFDNTATVKLDNGPDVKSNKVSVTVQCPDVTVTKEAVSGTINAGDTAAFKIVVKNNGTGTAYGVTLTDNLPAGVNWTINPAVTACDITGGVLSCSWPSLAAGASVTINVSGTTSAAACGTLNNTVTVAASNEAAGQANNQAGASITVNCADVTVTKQAVTGTINAGDTAAFKIVVTNIGAGTAYNVTVNDTLPAGITWTISPAVTGCAITGNTLSCSFASLAASASITINVSGATNAALCGKIDNTATVAASNETNTGNNSANANITVNCSDVTVTKEAVTGTINAGDTAAFKIVVSNVGAGTAYNVTLTDTLPAGITWTIDPAVTGCSITGNTLSCSFASLAAGASIEITVGGSTSAAVCGKLDNEATVAASNEANTSNNSAKASITVNCADVTVTKEAVNGTINGGDKAAFKIVVKNIGAGTAYNVTVSDTLPAGITWAIDPAVTGCSITGNTLSCSFATLAAGASVEIDVSGTASTTTCGKITNTVTVAASNEANTTNNSATASITVSCSDVTVTKTGNGPISAGDTAVFTITVTNLGPGTAANVLVTDVLPAGVAWSVDNAACTVNGTSLSCLFASLAANTPIIITVSGTTTANVCGALANSVSVSAANEDATKQGNNTATATVTVNCPDVKVTKTAASASIHFGQDAIYNIVVENIGAGKAYNVTLSDTLPGTVTWSLVQPVPACGLTGNSLSCAWPSLDPGAKITIQLKATISTIAQCANLTNTVTVTAANEKAANTANNTSTATITVTCPLDLTISKTAAPSFDRTFNWDISKDVNKTLVKQVSGNVIFKYTVVVAETGFTDSNWKVKGTITVHNPNSWIDIPVTSLTDVVDNGGACSISGFTAGTKVLAGASLILSYTCKYTTAPTSANGVNTATVTWDPSIGTPHGSATGTAAFKFGTGSCDNPCEVNRTVTVKDTFKGVATTLGTVTAVITQPYTVKTFTYTRSIPVVAGACLSYTNTARIVETGQKASQTVTVCGPAKTGARTIGFWKETNGQNLIKNYCSRSTTNKLGLYLAALGSGGGPFKNAPTACSDLATYVYNILNGASSTDMNKMLKAQMLATALDVWFSGQGWTSTTVSGIKPPSTFFQHNSLGTFQMDTTAICPRVGTLATGTVNCGNGLPGTDAVLAGAVPTSPMTMQAILNYAATVPPFNGMPATSVWYGGDRIKEEILKNLFDQFNNQLAFGSF